MPINGVNQRRRFIGSLIMAIASIGLVIPYPKYAEGASGSVITTQAALANCDDTARSEASTSPGSVATPVISPSDLAILDSLLRQNARAMSIANLALQKAQDSRVRRIALRIAESGAGENQLLRSWRSVWFPDAGSVDMSGATPDAIDSLASSCHGPAFDRAFLIVLDSELRTEVALAQSARSQASHPELRDYALSLIQARTTDIETIDALLATI